MRRMALILMTLLLLACNGEIIQNPDCEKLINGIMVNDDLIVKTEIEKQTSDLFADPTANDPLGHSDNLYTLTERLNSKCSSIVTSVQCYACIETYPLTSEIKMEFEYGGEIRTVIIDILTPEEDILRYAGMHSYLNSDD
jgi:hypothetical protein